MEVIRQNSCLDHWHWSFTDKSKWSYVSQDGRTTLFHMECSEGTSCVRANRPLPRDGNYYYWEVTIMEKVFGTSVMMGICNIRQDLHINNYCNLIGLDKNGWSLSHRGHLWHNGRRRDFINYFPGRGDITIGMLFDSARGTLSYYKNNECLGVAFTGLDKITEDLYPVIGSTALKTRIRLDGAYRGFYNLQDRCRFAIVRSLNRSLSDPNGMDALQHIPAILLQYIQELTQDINGDRYINLKKKIFINKDCLENNEDIEVVISSSF